MDAEAYEKLLILKLKRSDAVAHMKDEMKNGCDCQVVDETIKKLQEEIFYLKFNSVEYIDEIEII